MGANHQERIGTRLVPELAAKPAGGFVLVPAWAFIASWWACRTGDLRPLDLRVWLASFEAVARRCGARRGCRAAYTTGELRVLTGAGSDRSVRESLRRLGRIGLVAWSGEGPHHAGVVEEVVLSRPGPMLDALGLVSMPTRRVPMPRRLVRELCRSRSPTLLATSFGHLLRCLFNRRKACSSGGLCKASWVAEVFGISGRSVKRSRAGLSRAGVLRRERAPQRVMNRYGGWSAWNLRWQSTPRVGLVRGRTGVRVRCVRVSPPVVAGGGGVSPPRDTSNSLPGSENHQPTVNAARRSATRLVADGARASPWDRPRAGVHPRGLGHVRAKDLRSVGGLARLYSRALACGLATRSESGATAFVAAAVHAQRVATRNPGGLFATVVRGGLWRFISGEDEDRSRAAAREVWRVVGRPVSRPRNQVHEQWGHREAELPPARIRELVRRSLESVGCRAEASSAESSRCEEVTGSRRALPAGGRGPDGRGGGPAPAHRGTRCTSWRSVPRGPALPRG